jgi:hypothetical protein
LTPSNSFGRDAPKPPHYKSPDSAAQASALKIGKRLMQAMRAVRYGSGD